MMIIEAKEDSGILVIRLRGEIDLSSTEFLRNSIDSLLKEHKSNNLILDMSEVSFIDSSGLGVILGRYKKLSQKGGKIIIIQCQPQVFRVIEMSGLFRVIGYSVSEQLALAELKGERVCDE